MEVELVTFCEDGYTNVYVNRELAYTDKYKDCCESFISGLMYTCAQVNVQEFVVKSHYDSEYYLRELDLT